MKLLTVFAIALVMSAHFVCGQDDIARVSDEEIQSIKAFALQFASRDESEIERGRAAFYALRRDAATYPLIVAELLPLIADRAVDQDAQIRQGMIVDLLEHAGPQGKPAADILLKHALDIDAYFYLRGQCLRSAAVILPDDLRVQDAALTILEQPGPHTISSPYDEALSVISKSGVDSPRTSAVLTRMLEHPFRQLQDSAFIALGNLQLRQNPMTLDQAIEAMREPREFSDRELSAVLTTLQTLGVLVDTIDELQSNVDLAERRLRKKPRDVCSLRSLPRDRKALAEALEAYDLEKIKPVQLRLFAIARASGELGEHYRTDAIMQTLAKIRAPSDAASVATLLDFALAGFGSWTDRALETIDNSDPKTVDVFVAAFEKACLPEHRPNYTLRLNICLGLAKFGVDANPVLNHLLAEIRMLRTPQCSGDETRMVAESYFDLLTAICSPQEVQISDAQLSESWEAILGLIEADLAESKEQSGQTMRIEIALRAMAAIIVPANDGQRQRLAASAMQVISADDRNLQAAGLKVFQNAAVAFNSEQHKTLAGKIVELLRDLDAETLGDRMSKAGITDISELQAIAAVPHLLDTERTPVLRGLKELANYEPGEPTYVMDVLEYIAQAARDAIRQSKSKRMRDF